MKTPLVSIIIATFNSGNTLRNALDSVVEQNFQEWECIIVDGASNDNTVDIIQKFASIDKRFRYISESDNGIYDAFNKGWNMAKGEWIYYLGSDDTISTNGLKTLISMSNSFDIVYGDMDYKTGYNVKHKKSISINRLVGNMPSHQSMIMRKTLIEKLNGFDMERFRLCADFDLFQRALKNGAKIYYVPKTIACFNCMGASSKIIRYLKECYHIKKKYKGQIFALYYVVPEFTKRFLKKLIFHI